MYWSGTRDEMLRRLERARAAGAVGMIATLDWSFSNGRDWGSPWIPERLDLRAMARLAPEGLIRPRYLAAWLRDAAPARPDRAEHGRRRQAAPTFFQAYYQWMQSPLPSWSDVAGCGSSGTGRSCSRA